MRVEGSEQGAGRGRGPGREASRIRGAAGATADRWPTAGSGAGAGTVGGADSIVPATVAPGVVEATHVDGGAAALPISFARSAPPETVPFSGSTVMLFATVLPGLADTLSGTAGGSMIRLLEARENAAAIASLRAGIAGAPSPPGFLDAAWLATRADAGSSRGPGFGLEAAHVSWSDPASVEGAAVVAIGGTTVVMSDL